LALLRGFGWVCFASWLWLGLLGFASPRSFGLMLILKALSDHPGGFNWLWLALLLAIFRIVLLILKDLLALLGANK
jgi:hypothetical protein